MNEALMPTPYMNKVPIIFEHQGREYKGSFDGVQGSGTSKMWHLMVDNFYRGRLRFTDRGWVSDTTPKNPAMAELSTFFGDHVTGAT